MGFTLAEAFIKLSVKRDDVKPSIAAAVADTRKGAAEMQSAANAAARATGGGLASLAQRSGEVGRGIKGFAAHFSKLAGAAPMLSAGLSGIGGAASGVGAALSAISFGPIAAGATVVGLLAAAFVSARRDGESLTETLSRLLDATRGTTEAMAELAKQRSGLAGDFRKLNTPRVGTSKTDELREMQTKAREQAMKARELLMLRLQESRRAPGGAFGTGEFGTFTESSQADSRRLNEARAAVREANALLQKISAQLAETTAREVRKRQRDLFGGSPGNITRALLGITFSGAPIGGKMTDPKMLERNRAAVKAIFGADPGSDEYKKKAQDFRNDEMKRKARESKEDYSLFDETRGGRSHGGSEPKQQRFAVDQLARSIESTLGRQKDRNLQVAEASDQKLAKINANMEALVASSRGQRYATVAPA